VIKVFILARVRLYREGLERCLADRPTLTVTGSATDPVDAWPGLLAAPPDVLLLDLGATRGLAFAREVRTALPATRVIGLAVSETPADVIACAESGMSGYLTANATLPELVATIERASRGETACPPHLTTVLFERLAARAALPTAGPAEPPRLTAREIEVVALIQRRLTNKQIARTLSISLSTVKNHVHNVLRKLQVERRADVELIAVVPPARPPVVSTRSGTSEMP
jgi:two-component system nitrate/nitrite response regulator NarL